MSESPNAPGHDGLRWLLAAEAHCKKRHRCTDCAYTLAENARLKESLSAMTRRYSEASAEAERLVLRLDEACEQFDPGEERAQTASHQRRAANAEDKLLAALKRVTEAEAYVERIRDRVETERKRVRALPDYTERYHEECGMDEVLSWLLEDVL